MAQRKNTKKEALEASTAIKVVSQKDIALAEVPLTPEQEKELANCAERLVALGRKTTAQAFEYGEQLSKAQALVPPKKFGQWLDAHCGIKTKSAKNYTRVFHELAAYRPRLEMAAAAPAAMFALLGATEDAIETVLSTYEKGERPTVFQIKEMVSGADAAETDGSRTMEIGGHKGLTELAAQKAKSDTSLFMSLARSILADVQDAIEVTRTGKRVTKEGLADKIEYKARHAHDVLEVLIAPLDTEMQQSFQNWRPGRLPEHTAWGVVQRTFFQMGMKGDWPAKDDFAAWLSTKVHPVLRFVVNTEALPAELIPSEIQQVPEERKPAVATKPKIVAGTEFRLSESQQEQVEVQLEEVRQHLGETFTPELADQVRAVVHDGYRKVAELNVEIAANQGN
jgi:hypothetical protein